MPTLVVDQSSLLHHHKKHDDDDDNDDNHSSDDGSNKEKLIPIEGEETAGSLECQWLQEQLQPYHHQTTAKPTNTSTSDTSVTTINHNNHSNNHSGPYFARQQQQPAAAAAAAVAAPNTSTTTTSNDDDDDDNHHHHHPNNNTSCTINDDTTLSESFFDAVITTQQPQQEPLPHCGTTAPMTISTATTTFRLPRLPPQVPHPLGHRIVGPNEQYYIQHQYQSIVADRIHQYNNNNNNNTKKQLPEYTQLTPQEQVLEQQFVTNLLQRLGIHTNDGSSGGCDNKENNARSSLVVGESNKDEIHSPLPPSPIIVAVAAAARKMPPLSKTTASNAVLFTPIPTATTTTNHHHNPNNDDDNEEEEEISLDLFASPTTMTTIVPIATNHHPTTKMSSSSSSPSSVEITRCAVPTMAVDDDYESPSSNKYTSQQQRYSHLNHNDIDDENDYNINDTEDDDHSTNNNYKKRHATTSGKRGADMVRLRLLNDHDDDHFDNSNDNPITIPSPSKFLINAIDRLSIMMVDDIDNNNNNADIFPSSQSPIVQQQYPSPPSSSPYHNNNMNHHHQLSPRQRRRSSVSTESIEADDDLSFNDNNNNNDDYSDCSSTNTSTNRQYKRSTKNNNNENDFDSLVETTMLRDGNNNNQHHWDFDHTLIKDAPTDVRLRYGETIRYPKLVSERTAMTTTTTSTFSRQRPIGSTCTETTTEMGTRMNTVPPVLFTQSYPDPFRFYPNQLQQQLYRIYTWIVQRDQPTATTTTIQQQPSNGSRRRRRHSGGGCGAVLSVSEQHVTDIILKWHLDHPLLLDDSDITGPLVNHSSTSRNNVNQCRELCGKTLIVTRSKDELELWRRSFREGSELSIVNHAAMSVVQRKHPSCPAKLVHYDIVLSTYDAIKSADMAMKVDAVTGLVVTNPDRTTTDGWYTATSNTATQTQSRNGNVGDDMDSHNSCSKILSAVHKIQWCRIVFVDVVGRKGYVTKSDTTARVQAVRALNANTRWAFFVTTTTTDDSTRLTTTTTTAKNRKTAAATTTDTLCDRTTLVSLAMTLRYPITTTGAAAGDNSTSTVDIVRLRKNLIIDFQQ